MLELLAALTKFFLYAGAFAGAGAAFASASLGRRANGGVAGNIPIIRGGALLAAIAGLAAVAILILQLGGEFMGPAMSAVLSSPTGTALALQLAGAVLLLLFAGAGGLLQIAGLIGGGALLASFGVNGHAAAASPVAGFVAFLHVCAAAWWLGALFLLRPACSALAGADLVALVRRFSRIALVVVGAMVAAGLALVLVLVNFSHGFTPYAQLLATKIALAALALGLAANNKLALTPQLGGEDRVARKALGQSIVFEIFLIAGVLATTAILTTYTSPHV
jgi:putative copper export protein